MSATTALRLAEQGRIPTALVRFGIRRLLRRRLHDIRDNTVAGLVAELDRSPIAESTEAANEQHYELPPSFFELVLGPNRKYSGCYWPAGVSSLAEAEQASLEQVVQRAELEDGQRILELGCGWGSLSLYMAKLYPNARITAVSNSHAQRDYIRARAPRNLEVITADMNEFSADSPVDRIVSVEMFEHMRNYRALFSRVRQWLLPEGRAFVHVFCHRDRPYLFEPVDDDDWMARHFFTGGTMPAVDLFGALTEDLLITRHWVVDGTHYQRTAAAWRENHERHRVAILEIFATTYGDAAELWYNRWRLFFLSCEELFGFRNGSEWLVAHYLMQPAHADVPLAATPAMAG